MVLVRVVVKVRLVVVVQLVVMVRVIVMVPVVTTIVVVGDLSEYRGLSLCLLRLHEIACCTLRNVSMLYMGSASQSTTDWLPRLGRVMA